MKPSTFFFTRGLILSIGCAIKTMYEGYKAYRGYGHRSELGREGWGIITLMFLILTSLYFIEIPEGSISMSCGCGS